MTAAEVDAYRARRDAAREFFNSNRAAKIDPIIALAPRTGAFRAEAQSAIDSLTTRVRILRGLNDTSKEILLDLERRVGQSQ